ncbi:hypothetical protein IT407_03755 [Candidatus Uhrbacteria bacterium]|nr:hypothetical protein [Candidatus Uhrbacteria bacterium]
MSSQSVLDRILELVRHFRPERPVSKPIPREDSISGERLKSDDELVEYVRAHASEEGDGVFRAIRMIRSQDCLVTLAIDPDQPPYVRIASLNHLGSAADSVRIMIARTDHDPAVAISALQTLIDRRRAHEAVDTKHDDVKHYIRELSFA